MTHFGGIEIVKIFAPEESLELIRGWLIHARKSWKKQEEAARRFESRYWLLGSISLILSAVVGASLFSLLESASNPGMRVLAGIISILASVAASLITFQRYDERAEKHRAAAISYKAALRALEKMHAETISSTPDQASINQIAKKLDDIEKKLDSLEISAPVVPEDINNAIEESHKVYDFEDKAENLRPGQEDGG